MNELLYKICDLNNINLASPWADADYTIFSDGVIAVRVPRIPEVVRESPVAKHLPFGLDPGGDWIGIPEYTLPPPDTCKICSGTGTVKICPECDGEGTIDLSSGFNTYEVECASCDGDGVGFGTKDVCRACDGLGVKDQQHLVNICGNDVDGFRLDKIKDLPGIKINTVAINNMFHFRFDGGDGILMALEW